MRKKREPLDERRIVREALIRWCRGKTGYRRGADYAAFCVNEARSKVGNKERTTGEILRLTLYFRLIQKRMYTKKR